MLAGRPDHGPPLTRTVPRWFNNCRKMTSFFQSCWDFFCHLRKGPGFLVGTVLPNHIPAEPLLRLLPTMATGRQKVTGSTSFATSSLQRHGALPRPKSKPSVTCVEWASGGVFKYGDVGRMTGADVPRLRAATELMASALSDTSC